MDEKIRVYYYEKQRLGNYQIKVGKKRDTTSFRWYLETVLRKMNDNITDSTKEPNRRYYVEDEHIEYMKTDELIDLQKAYIWRKNNG